MKTLDERRKICTGKQNSRNFAPKSNFSAIMKIINILAIALLAANTAVASCSTSRAETDTRADAVRTITLTQKYQAVEVSHALVVNYTAKSDLQATECRITGPREVVENVEMTVNDGVLRISLKRTVHNNVDRTTTVNVTGLPVNRFESSVACTLNLCNSLSTKGMFSLDTSAAGIINVNRKLSCAKLFAEVSSGGVINIADTACSGTLGIDANSGGIINATATCADFAIDASSGAVVKLTGKAGSGAIDASSGSIVSCDKMEIAGRVVVEASSGAVVSPGKKATASTSSGAIIN